MMTDSRPEGGGERGRRKQEGGGEGEGRGEEGSLGEGEESGVAGRAGEGKWGSGVRRIACMRHPLVPRLTVCIH